MMEKSMSFPDYSGGFRYVDAGGRSNSYNFNGPSRKDYGFASSGDAELKRKHRIAAYNAFMVEAKFKSSIRNSFKWIKAKFSDVPYGHG